MNTDYRLFGPEGPRVSPEATHWSRLDEMAKCVAVCPHYAAIRLFYADGVISVEGPELGGWMRHIGKKAPSEQQIVAFLWPNIEAAWRGETLTRTLHEAIAESEGCPEAIEQCESGQPTPGVYVYKSRIGEAASRQSKSWGAGWSTDPTAESAAFFLSRLPHNKYCHRDMSKKPSASVVGVLLDVGGVDLRFLSSRLCAGTSSSDTVDAQACVTVLGGPKGISQPFKNALQAVFEAASVPLVRVCLGPTEQMAHACIAFMRLQEDAGRYKSAVVDVLRLGHEGYVQLVEVMESTVCQLEKPQAANFGESLRKQMLRSLRTTPQLSRLRSGGASRPMQCCAFRKRKPG